VSQRHSRKGTGKYSVRPQQPTKVRSKLVAFGIRIGQSGNDRLRTNSLGYDPTLKPAAKAIIGFSFYFTTAPSVFEGGQPDFLISNPVCSRHTVSTVRTMQARSAIRQRGDRRMKGTRNAEQAPAGNVPDVIRAVRTLRRCFVPGSPCGWSGVAGRWQTARSRFNSTNPPVEVVLERTATKSSRRADDRATTGWRCPSPRMKQWRDNPENSFPNQSPHTARLCNSFLAMTMPEALQPLPSGTEKISQGPAVARTLQADGKKRIS